MDFALFSAESAYVLNRRLQPSARKRWKAHENRIHEKQTDLSNHLITLKITLSVLCVVLRSNKTAWLTRRPKTPPPSGAFHDFKGICWNRMLLCASSRSISL